jgi:hypothetical protein
MTAGQVFVPLYVDRDPIIDKHPVPDSGFTFEIASDMGDAIQWLAAHNGIVVGTENAEWIIPPDVNAVNVRAVLNSRYGSSGIQGTVVDNAVCFFQTGKKALVEYYIPQQDNYFRANNMAMLNPDALGESEAREFDFVRSPYTRLFITRADGTAVTLLYERGFGVFAWGRITTDGAVLSAAAMPGPDGNDDIYLAVKRGDTVYLEALREAAVVYLDSYTRVTKEYFDNIDSGIDGDQTAAKWEQMTLGYDLGKAVLARVAKSGPELDAPDVYEELPAGDPPDWDRGGEVYIGYRYKSVMRTMPVLANNQMKKQRITALVFRFLNSFLPKVTSIAGGRAIQTDTITNLKTPYSGVWKIPFPGTWDEDVQAELSTEEAAPVMILALSAEVQ